MLTMWIVIIIIIIRGHYLEISIESLPGEWLNHFCMLSAEMVQIPLCVCILGMVCGFYTKEQIKTENGIKQKCHFINYSTL